MTALPDVLNVDHVLARYGIKDPRAARRVMREAGAFVVAGRLVVRADDLDAHERAQAEAARRAQTTQETPRRPRTARGTQTTPQPRREPLQPGWWREAPQ